MTVRSNTRRIWGEGRLEGTKDNDIHYALGVACEALGDAQRARRRV